MEKDVNPGIPAAQGESAYCKEVCAGCPGPFSAAGRANDTE